MPETALVILAKAPQPGRVKTRLAADLGIEAALWVYRQLLEVTDRARRGWSGPVLLASSGDERAWSGCGLASLPRHPQPVTHLGGRIADALSWGLHFAGRCLVIGTDCPALRPEHLRGLARALDQAPVAFGPAHDGGYWGVGVARAAPIPVLAAEDLPWSGARLLEESIQRLTAADLDSRCTDALGDCDTIEDWQQACAQGLLRSFG